MKPNNPFLMAGYHSPEFFCDREAYFRFAAGHFAADGMQCQRSRRLYHL